MNDIFFVRMVKFVVFVKVRLDEKKMIFVLMKVVNEERTGMF